MRKKLTLTITTDAYDAMQELPRRVSVSEVVSWVLKSMAEDFKRHGFKTDAEYVQWLESTPEGRDYRDRLTEHWGPGIKKIDAVVDKAKKAVKLGKK